MNDANFGDFHVAARMRDFLRRLVKKEIDAAIPHDQFGIVQSVDLNSGRAVIDIPGQDPITLGFTDNIPTVGNSVRITGRTGSRYMTVAGSGVPGGGGGAGGGGITVVDDITAIPTNKRSVGMLVYQNQDQTNFTLGLYELVGGIDDGFWQRITTTTDVTELIGLGRATPLRSTSTDPFDSTINVVYFGWGPLNGDPAAAIWSIVRIRLDANGRPSEKWWSAPNSSWNNKETVTTILEEFTP